ncbi:MAG: hypothetical protein J6J26_00335 [Bacteroides sp.]|nr:hypothetical protein [Bacteroides sp.]
MILGLLIIIGIIFVGGIVLGIANIVSGGKLLGGNEYPDQLTDTDDHQWTGFAHDSYDSHAGDSHSYSDPFDNHWESSFDWKDEDNDGYDDRDDGFWNEREF